MKRAFVETHVPSTAAASLRVARHAPAAPRGPAPDVGFDFSRVRVTAGGASILQRAGTSDTAAAQDMAGLPCFRSLFPLSGRVTWSGLDQTILDANVRVKDEDLSILKKATAGTTQFGVDAVYFGANRGWEVIKVPDHCTIEYGGSLDAFTSCCNVAASVYQGLHDRDTQPRPGTDTEFGVPNTPAEWEKAK